MKVVELELASKANVVNKNGRLYTEKCFQNMKKNIAEKLKDGKIVVNIKERRTPSFGASDFVTTDPQSILGTCLEWTDKYKMLVAVPEDKFNFFCSDHL